MTSAQTYRAVRLVVGPVLGLAIVNSGCIAGDVSRDEVARAAAPSGSVEAVLVESNAGATTSFGYDVFLVSPGQSAQPERRVASLYGAVRSASAYGVNLRWDDEHTLALEYREAKRADLERPVFIVGADSVRVVLRSGIEDPAAPGGGMLYNLRGRR
jgi:hypothetical protein